MKVLALFSVLFTVCQASTPAPAFLAVPRGGADLGPIDADLAMKLSKTVTTAYVAGTASKFINKQTGGSDTQLGEFVTGDLFQLHALITAVACAMFKLSGSGFGELDTIAGGALLALALKLQSEGIKADTIKNNAVQAAIAVLLAVVAFIK